MAKKNAQIYYVTVPAQRVDEFLMAFDVAVREQLAQRPGPIVWTNGSVALVDINTDVLLSLEGLEPYGREFPPALFVVEGFVRSTRTVGRHGNQLQLELEAGGKSLKGIWFNACEPKDLPPVLDRTRPVRRLASPAFNHCRGSRTIQLQLRGVVEQAPRRAGGA